MDSNSRKSENFEETFPEDEILSKIFDAENKSISKFFDAIFGYLYRNSPDQIFDSSKYYGKQVMISSFEKWETKYVKNFKPKNTLKRTRSESSPMENNQDDLNCWNDAPKPGGPTSTINTCTMSKRTSVHSSSTSLTNSKKDEEEDSSKSSFFDTTNGAALDKYCWTQSVDELEARVPVDKFIRKGNQVDVEIEKQTLKVRVQQENKEFTTVMEGELLHPIRKDDSMWLLSPEQHISLLLEKVEDKWWDRLLVSESPIDMKKINPERDFQTLPEEDRQMIQNVVEDKRKEALGEPTADQKKMECVLRKAWDMEGSPFKGQPFDPSIVKALPPTASKSNS